MVEDLTPPSFWLETCGEALTPRPALAGDTDADVAIVGAGYTGLWTAHHLLRHEPGLRVVVVEREIAGWGASGRNGGWCSALFATSWERLARRGGLDAARRMRRALERTVDDVGAFCAEYRVDAHHVRGGTLTVARSAAQRRRLASGFDAGRAVTPDVRWLAGEEVRDRVGVTDALAATWDPACAALHPGRLVRGLARVVTGAGARLFEGTAAVEPAPGRVVTDRGTVRAPVTVRATEAYTADLGRPYRRLLAPVWSLVIATEPLDRAVWDELGCAGRETVSDERHLIIYAQRTADDRIVFGGRGAPYAFGSRTSGGRGHAASHQRLERELRAMFPAIGAARITHRWGGVLGVPRDWMPSVGFDRASGQAWAGGYVGDGVACAALAGRTLADLVLGLDTEETRLPWVGHRWRQWEPEPLRWAGIHGMTAVMASADRTERRTGRPAARAAVARRLLGG